MTNPWTTLTRGDRDFDMDINKRSVVAARDHLRSDSVLFNKVGQAITINRPYYSERIDGLTGGVQEMAEGTQEAPPLTPVNVADIKLRPRLYGAGLNLSKERVDDAGLLLPQSLVPKILERMFERVEIDFQNLLINTATTFNAERDQRDGVALGSAAHPVGQTGTLSSNVAGTPSALSESSLSAAITSFMSIYDDNGDFAPRRPKKFLLLVHPTKMLYAMQLVKSLSSTADYKNSGVLNPVSSANGFNIEVMPAWYQQSATQWTLISVDQGDSGLLVVMRQPPGAPQKIVRQNPDQVQWYSKMRYAIGFNDWRNVYVNLGA